MTDFRAPGVYAEEFNPDKHTIYGVSTSTAAFVGFTPSGPLSPTLITTYPDYVGTYGIAASAVGYTGRAVKAFFDNGGQQAYVSRVDTAPADPSCLLTPLADIADISIVCCPDEYGVAGMAAALVAHCEKRRDRIAILAAPLNGDLAAGPPEEARSRYAAYYAPWVVVEDASGMPGPVHPGGHIAGAMANSDAQRGVWKAPANISILDAVGLTQTITDHQQSALNGIGVNTLRHFPGRGILVWGARTTSQDPDWKYINVRRYMIFLEKSIENGLSWVVFEPNGPPLWSKVKQSVSQFLQSQFQQGALVGTTPNQAYFVRCDQTTMTQDDIDNGRLICEIGVAQLYPAEFIIFQIGLWARRGS